MKVAQLYTKCLAQGAYFIQSENEAAIIDPLRETAPYLNLLVENNLKLKYIFETHFHADFVSGHLDLSQKTKAQIVYGSKAECDFDCLKAEDGAEFSVGKITLKALHTPGHTLESTCYLLLDENKNPHCVFTGDTLFIGDVGRPDLAQNIEKKITQEDLAGYLFDSLRTKLMPLPDSVLVYPAHGAGSACGKSMSQETYSTLGDQKKLNYALRQNMTKQEFIKEVLDGLTAPPAYFAMNVSLNKKGYSPFDLVKENSLKSLTVEEFRNIYQQGDSIILDTRSAEEFSNSHIEEAINIGLNGDFAPWVGTIIKNVKQKILLITEIGKEEETITRLARVGFDNVVGYLNKGIKSWLESNFPINSILSISPKTYFEQYQEKYKPLDVRKLSEYKLGHIKNAQHFPLAEIDTWHKNLDKNLFYAVYCGGGYRSMVACSYLKNKKFKNILDINGGYKAIAEYKQKTNSQENMLLPKQN